jgi:hypothetical protein
MSVFAGMGIALDKREVALLLGQIRQFVGFHKRPPENADLLALHRQLAGAGDAFSDAERAALNV